VSTPFAAIRALAAFELRRRWKGLVVIGLVAGLVGAAIVGAVVVARRTATAHARLERAVHVEDARVLLFDRSLTDEVAALPGVDFAWEASLYVAKLGGPGVNYVGMVSGPERPDDLFTPIVVEGRAADPNRADEAVVIEQAALAFGVGAGDELDVTLLLPEEVAMFDTGFGEPDGPSTTLHITGVVRIPGDVDGSPVIAGPAFLETFGQYAAGSTLFVRLDDDPGARQAFLDGARRINASAVPVPGGEEFDPVAVTDSARNEQSVVATARVLVGGLGVFVAVALIAGLVGLAQLLVRHHSAGASQQRVEAALGLTGTERVLVRVVPALVAASVAGAVTVAGALLAGRIEPSGALRRVEPHPGWSPNVAIAFAGGAAVALLVVVMSAVAARRAGGESARADAAPGRAVRWARAVTSAPSVVAGLGFAFGGRGERGSTTRSSFAGVVVGVAGLVAAMTFASSLDRLVSTPSRYGWNGDFAVVDSNDEITAELLADERLEAVTVVASRSFEIEGDNVTGYTFVDRRGTTGWTVLGGRTPTAGGEIMLSARTADRFGRDVGDTVVARGANGGEFDLTVVGVGVGPTLGGERTDELVLVSEDDGGRLGSNESFVETFVRVAPGVDVDEVVAGYAPTYELARRELPPDLRNLDELGRLPEALGMFLALLGVIALVHSLVLTSIRRAHDLAVLRAVGFTRRQVGASVATTAVGVAAIGVLVGAPLGILVGRLVWWGVADAVGVATDVRLAITTLVVGAPVVFAVAVLASVLPARRVARRAPMAALRAE
jgi:putative ABC transport system permease protein